MWRPRHLRYARRCSADSVPAFEHAADDKINFWTNTLVYGVDLFLSRWCDWSPLLYYSSLPRVNKRMRLQ